MIPSDPLEIARLQVGAPEPMLVFHLADGTFTVFTGGHPREALRAVADGTVDLGVPVVGVTGLMHGTAVALNPDGTVKGTPELTISISANTEVMASVLLMPDGVHELCDPWADVPPAEMSDLIRRVLKVQP